MKAYLLFGDAHRGNWFERIASAPQEINDAHRQVINLVATKGGDLSIALVSEFEDEPVFAHLVGPVSEGMQVSTNVPVAKFFAMDFLPNPSSVDIFDPRERAQEQIGGCIGFRNAAVMTLLLTLSAVAVYWLGVGW